MNHLSDLADRARAQGRARTMAVVSPHDEHTFEAAARAAREGWLSVIFIGDKDKIEALSAAHPCPNASVIDVPDGDMAAKKAALMARAGQCSTIMKGAIETAGIMRAMLDREHGVRAGGTMSLLALMESPFYHKLFGVTDVGLLTYPSLEQKADAIRNAVTLFHHLGIEKPKVAALAAVEKVNPAMKETVEARALRDMASKGAIPGCVIEGPISYDLAMKPGAAAIKGFESEVAGDADLLLAPDIACGNVLNKALSATGGAKNAYVVLGAKVPLVIPSRSASTEDKYLSVALAAIAMGDNV